VAARRHLEALFAVGWTYRAVARRAGVSIPTLVRLRRGPRSTIGPAVATRVLAVGGPPGAGVDPLPRRRRPAAPLRRHVDELHTAGWSWTAIGQRTGISEAALRRLRAGITRDVDAARASRLFALGDP
jgi:AraC-like DNA-binding protein